MFFKKNHQVTNDFEKIIISLASSEAILESSRGRVQIPQTINYRSYKPEVGGLFCERIFGPVKDWECYCGKYKRIRYRGIVCDKCGVEVTEKRVRRERMGHIELVVPVAHIWYFRSLPNKIGYILGLPTKKLDLIIYYERYIVIQPGVLENEVKKMDFLNDEEYLNLVAKLPENNDLLPDNDPNKFIALMGAEAIQKLLAKVDLNSLAAQLRHSAANDNSQQRKTESLKRLRIVEAFRESNKRLKNNPEWMIIQMIPVIPPDLRPLVPLDGGRFASSDLNDLYRRVIIRNSRLRRLMDIKAPDVILRNEKRMLQEAVDALFDNSRKANAVRGENNRALKSLSDVLKGKSGRFRQNLLGKRVDYSGRSVIVVGPKLQLHECGLPKHMAAELFKPFIMRKLNERGIVKTVKTAKKIVERKDSIVWDILEDVLKGHPILLNRAPTLHRMGIQAFQPKLVEGRAIQLHPLVCTAFNADFDGDQMAVHVPLSHEAILEATILMLASHNILNPANGNPITVPSQDMVLGLYYLTKLRPKPSGKVSTFYGPEEVIIAYNEGQLKVHDPVKVKVDVRNEVGELIPQIVETAVGRVVFNEIVPPEVGFVNELLTKKAIQKVIGQVFKIMGMQQTAIFLDDVKNLGFKMSYQGGLSFGLDDIIIPNIKEESIEKARAEVQVVSDNYEMGLITDNDRYNQITDIWSRLNIGLTDTLMKEMETDQAGFNPVYMMMHSGARGSREQIRQLGGMRGLMAKPRKSVQGSVGEIIENPILSNFKEGLDVLEYFISTHGARKGLADTALKTADAGYLTRRLVDVAQDVIVNEEDCGTLRGLAVESLKQNDEIIQPLGERILGRVTVHDIYDPITDNLIVKAGELITEDVVREIEQSPIDSVEIRSALTCETQRGICIKCYGRNLATNRVVQIGEAVGIIAAQSIGEPGTQLTLRTFHEGGVATNVTVDTVIEAKFKGRVVFQNIRYLDAKPFTEKEELVVTTNFGELKVIDLNNEELVLFQTKVPYGALLTVREGDIVEKDQKLYHWDPYNKVILAQNEGTISFQAIIEGATYREEIDEQTGFKEKVITDSKDKTKIPTIIVSGEDGSKKNYNMPSNTHLAVEEGDTVKAGQILAKLPRSIGKSRDITGGLPRVTELFEARNPSSPAVVSEIQGIASYGAIKRGNREIHIKHEESGSKRSYMVPLSKHILVQEGEEIEAGTRLCDGAIMPSDILTIQGPKAVQEYLVNEIQDVYRLQDVKINDKHIEVIVRQMMQKVHIVNSGDTTFLPNQVVDKWTFREQNDEILDKKVVEEAGDSVNLKPGMIITNRRLRDENSKLRRRGLKLVQVRQAEPAVSRPALQGITQAALDTESFISAASFQETTKVLSEAAINGKCDDLKGLKENVIVGHLIPAGTGTRQFQNVRVSSKEEYRNLKATTKRTAAARRKPKTTAKTVL